MTELVAKNVLKALVPINALNAKNFQELSSKTFIEDIPADKIIFAAGNIDRKSVYLIDGEVEIASASGARKIVTSGSEKARHPLANQQPRKHTATAKVDSKVIRIDLDLLDILLTWDQMSGVEVDEIQAEESGAEANTDDNDWMTYILQSKAFVQLPPANIQALFMRMQEVSFKKGNAVIKQGEEGDFYYIIKQGKCKVTRSSKMGSELILATLGKGDAFGEEALLSEAKRNANVTMTTDGSLMRLSKEDFHMLLQEPMLNWVTNAEADALVKNEGAVWIDVRFESEHKNANIAGSINIPFFMLRLKAQTLAPDKKYILYCNSGRQSSVGSFLLSERGMKAYCLKGGMVDRSESNA